MTTLTYSSVLDHSSTAGFDAWGLELSTKLATVGLVQTADTGQINWGSSPARPGTNVAAGYEIWRFSDSSLYIKLEYGTGASATAPGLWITVGTGSNGSGTITGQTSTRGSIVSNTAPTSTAVAYTTYLCHTTNAFCICFKANGTSSSAGHIGVAMIGKTVDSAGAATTTGFGVLRCTNTSGVMSFQSVRIAATAVTYTDSALYTCIPGAPTSSLVGSDIQVYTIWANVPQVQPWPWAGVYVAAEITELNTFSFAPVGSASHTYLALGTNASGMTVAGNAANVYGHTMLWE